jgi:hypothetical protein
MKLITLFPPFFLNTNETTFVSLSKTKQDQQDQDSEMGALWGAHRGGTTKPQEGSKA